MYDRSKNLGNVSSQSFSKKILLYFSDVEFDNDSSMDDSDSSREESRIADISNDETKNSTKEEVDENDVKEEEKEDSESLEACTIQEPTTTNDSPEDDKKEERPPANEDNEDDISVSEFQSSEKESLSEATTVVEVEIVGDISSCKKDQEIIIIDDSVEEESTNDQKQKEAVESISSKECQADVIQTEQFCET